MRSAGEARYAVVLSGGGARGAYEAGVLLYLLDDLPKRLGRPIHFDVLTGTSVGAIHACYVAATQGLPGAGAQLIDVWRSFDVASVYQVGITDVVRFPLRLLGFGRGTPEIGGPVERLSSLLDTRPLEKLVQERIPWRRLRDNVHSGAIDALAITATEIGSGKSVVWVDNATGTVRPWTHDPFVTARAATLTPIHALASAAIPFLFPALRIDGNYYCDGGLRMNTPLAPALRLGANRLLIIGLRHVPSPEEEVVLSRAREANYDSLPYLAGKVLNALLLDHIDYDVDRLDLVNAMLETGIRAYGPEFLTRMNETIVQLRGTPYRLVKNIYLQPSRDLGVMAAECLQHYRDTSTVRSWVAETIIRYAVHGIAAEADLLSYLLFDRCYAEHLIQLGRLDAEAQEDELVAFFSDDGDAYGNDGSLGTGG